MVFDRDKAFDIAYEAGQCMASHPFRTAEQVRNTIMGSDRGVMIANPNLAIQQHDLSFLFNLIKLCVKEGRMIDFGYIPNEIIKTESIRARKVFEAGELIHPYIDWLGCTSWEGGYNIYYVLNDADRPNHIYAVELYGVHLPDYDVILMMDASSLNLQAGKGGVLISPVAVKMRDMDTEAEQRRRGSNVLDPLVTMLRFMADASIPLERKEVAEKLNKARAKRGVEPIPPHTQVVVKDYVTKFQHHKAESNGKRESKGGHHASPIAHFRVAHRRNLANGQNIPVKSSRVNWRDQSELHRLFYKVKKEQ